MAASVPEIKALVDSAALQYASDPYGFITYRDSDLKNEGLYFIKEKHGKDGLEIEEVRIGDPIDVIGETRNSENHGWGLYLQWHDRDKIRHLWAMPKSMLSGDGNELMGELFDRGWNGDPQYKRQLVRYLMMVRSCFRIRCASHVGWHGSQDGSMVYVLPDTILGASTACEKVVLQTNSSRTGYAVLGSLEKQKELFGLCIGNSRLLLALTASFAGPLLAPAGMSGGGFHLYGGTSTGKSTALHVAGSVWDNCEVLPTWRATDNALEAVFSLHSDNLTILDEIGQAPDNAVANIVYMAANGRGKQRAKSNSMLRSSYQWRTMILSNGEMRCITKIELSGKKSQAGQEVRLVDIPADAGCGKGLFEDLHGYQDGNAFSMALKEMATQNYGHAGRAFIEHIATKMDEIKKTISPALKKLVSGFCPDESDGQVKRVAQRFALCAYTGMLLIEAGLLPCSTEQILASIKLCFEAWIRERGGVGSAAEKPFLKIGFQMNREGPFAAVYAYHARRGLLHRMDVLRKGVLDISSVLVFLPAFERG